jgi:hypothetical protein
MQHVNLDQILDFKKGFLTRRQWLIPVILAIQEAEIGRIEVQSQPRQTVLKNLSQKYPTQKRTGGMAQVVEHLPSKHEALNSKTPVPQSHTKNHT